MIHPPRWRGPGSTSTKAMDRVRSALRKLDIEWLSVHPLKDGERHFGASTPFDMYVIRNTSTSEFLTSFSDLDENEFDVCIKDMAFIPGTDIDFILSLVAKDGEESVNMVYSRVMYGADREWMSKTECSEFKYPVIHATSRVDGTPKFHYSNCYISDRDPENEMRVPKIVFGVGNQSGRPYVDYKGEYPLTQYAAGITDDPAKFDLIAKVMDGNRFRNVMKAVYFSTEDWNRHVIALLRKDFWKDFVDENGNLIDKGGNVIDRDGNRIVSK